MSTTEPTTEPTTRTTRAPDGIAAVDDLRIAEEQLAMARRAVEGLVGRFDELADRRDERWGVAVSPDDPADPVGDDDHGRWLRTDVYLLDGDGREPECPGGNLLVRGAVTFARENASGATLYAFTTALRDDARAAALVASRSNGRHL
jgi:hypothetical protein